MMALASCCLINSMKKILIGKHVILIYEKILNLQDKHAEL